MANRKLLLTGVAGLGLLASAMALAQDRPDSLLPPGFDEPPPPPQPAPRPQPQPQPRPVPPVEQEPDADANGEDEEAADLSLADIEGNVLVESEDVSSDDELTLPNAGHASAMFDRDAFAGAPGPVIVQWMRGLQLPLASRWGHIALRNAVLAGSVAPNGVSDSDWLAERAWLLVRMGEADAARLLLSPVPTRRYNEKLSQVALQVALATSDPGAMCPIPSSLDDAEPRAANLVEAFCEALVGTPELAGEAVRRERRRGRVGGIDLSLADKLIGAGAGTGRSASIEWEQADRLTSWRYGLATATGITIPQRLMADALPRVHAWYARAPLIDPEQRLSSARIAAGMGVLSGQAMVNFHALTYRGVDVDALGGSIPFQLRRAFVGDDIGERLTAMRTLWTDAGQDELARMGALVTTARAAALVRPDDELASDAGNLIASLLTSGYEQRVMRWTGAIAAMDEDEADSGWAQLALASPTATNLDLSEGRIRDFLGRHEDEPRKGALLVAGLAALGRIDAPLLAELDGDYDLGILRQSNATRLMDRAGGTGSDGMTVMLAAVLMQGDSVGHVAPRYFYIVVKALRTSGNPFLARMVAAEALGRL
ncbi:hypothetical protein [Sphingomicrobium flavum]|uniref:hypothetical protein n=1 Tax=Sphingomicrobium flavum TaxID=1229164 RepID=UPI0021ADC83E|nr:hypothetical protein [Sphingomicrobium flavum]